MKEKNKKVYLAVLAAVILLAVLSSLSWNAINQKKHEIKYDSVKETTTGKEITLIAATYINADIVSAQWDEEVLECIEKGSVETGMFAGRMRKQYYVFKGVNPGRAEAEFVIQKFGDVYRKTYEILVSDDLTVTVQSITEEKAEENENSPEITRESEDNDLREDTVNQTTEDEGLFLGEGEPDLVIFTALYSDTMQKINGLDDYRVDGYELVYIDNDDVPELVVSVDYFGNILFLYTVDNGEVIPYCISDEWFTIDDPLDTGICNGLDLGQGNGNQEKELSYLTHSGNLVYVYKERDYDDNLTEEYYHYDGAGWEQIDYDEISRNLDNGWQKLDYIYASE